MYGDDNDDARDDVSYALYLRVSQLEKDAAAEAAALAVRHAAARRLQGFARAIAEARGVAGGLSGIVASAAFRAAYFQQQQGFRPKAGAVDAALLAKQREVGASNARRRPPMIFCRRHPALLSAVYPLAPPISGRAAPAPPHSGNARCLRRPQERRREEKRREEKRLYHEALGRATRRR